MSHSSIGTQITRKEAKLGGGGMFIGNFGGEDLGFMTAFCALMKTEEKNNIAR